MIPRRITVLLLLLTGTVVGAQIPKMKRSEAHERLDFLVGRWTIESRMYMGDKIHEGRHPATIEWLPGGVWLEERTEMPETPIGPMFGSARTAWDERAGEYVRHWIDNQSHVVLTMRGTPTDERTLEFTGSFTWIDGTVFHQRLIVRRLEDGGWSQTGYMGRDPDELRLNHEGRAILVETERASANGPPAWFRKHMEYVTRAGGRWIADNRAYRSENEPFDAYGTEWSWGVGKQSIVGRLFGLRGGEEAGTFWEFRLIWDPGAGRVLAHQFGAQGVVGSGPMERAGPGRTRMDQTFTAPDGTTFRTGHDARETDADTQRTESFDILDDGTWKTRRAYVWKRETPAQGNP